MSIIFNPDTSVQLPAQNTFTSSTDTTNLNDWSKVAGSNLYNTSLANVSIGTTSVATYKLNVNGSLNFTSLYQTGTLINFANFATDSELTSGLATKQNTLTAATNLLGIGSAITALDYTKITLNKPSVFPPDVANIYIKSEVNQLITNTSNYTTNASNALKTNIDTNNTTTNTNSSNFTSGTSNILRTLINTNLGSSSNFTSGTSNILRTLINTNLDSSSNFTSGTSNILRTLINTNLDSSSNFTSGTSNILRTLINTNLGSSSNFTLGTSNILRGLINTNLDNSSNFTSGTSNILRTLINTNLDNSSNFTSGTSNILRTLINTNLGSSSNYASNISNIINANFLKLSGGVMSGQITGVTTLNGTTGIFGQITTTNNTNVGAPTNGVYGGNGDKIILWAGAVGALPYSLGINASTLWYSVPAGSSHIFYVGGTNRLSLSSTMTTIATDLTINKTNNFIQFGATNGNNIAVPDTNNFFSTSALANDMVIRSINNLHLLSGSGNSAITIKATNNRVGISTNNPICTLDVAGIGCIHNGTPYAPANNFMRPGSLTIGGMSSNFGGGNNWSVNTAGLLMECLDNTEIAVHDAGNRLASLMYYQGGVSSSTITIGRDMGWNAITNVNILGTLTSLNTTINGVLKLKNDVWHTSIDGINRLYYSANERSYYCCGANSTIGHLFMNSVYSEVFSIYNNGNVSIGGIDPTTFKLAVNGAIRMSSFDIVNSDGSVSHFQFSNGANYIRGRLIMDRAADTVSISANVGIGGAPTNYKLEVYGSVYVRGSIGIENENLNIYRSAGGIGGNINAGGNITCLLYSISNSGTDYVGVGNVADNNQNYIRQLYIMYGTFTGFHRCFTNDELFDNENPQDFKDNYVGRIVVSTGRIATDLKSIDNDEWEIKYDKEGITIEDALPMIELSRKKKDKRVFGVMGSSKRNNSRTERLIINSVGEGGIFVCNSNGNIENGDYITSSDHLGYGEKQDDDILHNYTVAKATMDCNFELDSNLYNCFEIENGLRIAFIACTYHCG
jgi:hypothetical protein